MRTRCPSPLGKLLTVAVLVASLSSPATAQDEELRVLFVGNSLTYENNLPGILGALIDSSGLGPTTMARVAFPNFGLEDHWIEGTARAAIASQRWSVVAMQQGPSATEAAHKHANPHRQIDRSLGTQPDSTTSRPTHAANRYDGSAGCA